MYDPLIKNMYVTAISALVQATAVLIIFGIFLVIRRAVRRKDPTHFSDTPPKSNSAFDYSSTVPADVEANLDIFPIEKHSSFDESGIYTDIAKELETGTQDKGLWIRLYAECGGDETQTKVLYIKQRASLLISGERARLEIIEQGITDKMKNQAEPSNDKIKTNAENDQFIVKSCPNCRAINNGASTTCSRCGAVLPD